MNTLTAHKENQAPQALPTEAFVLPELTLIPFEPGQHMLTIARMDRPFRDIGGSTFPNVLISVLPGPGQATIENGKSSWLSSLGESVMVDVQITGAILVFLTIRPADYETTGLYIQIKKVEPKQDVAPQVQFFGQPQGQPAGVFPGQGVSPFGQTVASSPQHTAPPASSNSTSAQLDGGSADLPFATQGFDKRFQSQAGLASLQLAGSGQNSLAKPTNMPRFGAKPFGQQVFPFAQTQEMRQDHTPLSQAKPFASVFGAGNAQPGAGDAIINMFAHSHGTQQASEFPGAPQPGAKPFGQQESPLTQAQVPIQPPSALPPAKPFVNVFGNGNAQSGPRDGKSGAFAYSPAFHQSVEPSGIKPVLPQEATRNASSFAPFVQQVPLRPEIKPVLVHACGHIQHRGDVPYNPGESIGTPSSQCRLEAVAFKPDGIDPAQFEYATVSHDGRLSPWTSFPHFSGSRGSSMPLLGFVARLTGDAADKYQVVYSGSFLKTGQAPEARDGQFLHSSIQGDALESLSLRIVPKD